MQTGHPTLLVVSRRFGRQDAPVHWMAPRQDWHKGTERLNQDAPSADTDLVSNGTARGDETICLTALLLEVLKEWAGDLGIGPRSRDAGVRQKQ